MKFLKIIYIKGYISQSKKSTEEVIDTGPLILFGGGVCVHKYRKKGTGSCALTEAYFAADNRNNSSSLEIPPKLGNSVDPTADSVLGAAAQH